MAGVDHDSPHFQPELPRQRAARRERSRSHLPRLGRGRGLLFRLGDRSDGVLHRADDRRALRRRIRRRLGLRGNLLLFFFVLVFLLVLLFFVLLHRPDERLGVRRIVLRQPPRDRGAFVRISGPRREPERRRQRLRAGRPPIFVIHLPEGRDRRPLVDRRPRDVPQLRPRPRRGERSLGRAGPIRRRFHRPVELAQNRLPPVPIVPATSVVPQLLERGLPLFELACLYDSGRRTRAGGTRDQREGGSEDERTHTATVARRSIPSTFPPTRAYVHRYRRIPAAAKSARERRSASRQRRRRPCSRATDQPITRQTPARTSAPTGAPPGRSPDSAACRARRRAAPA